MFRTFVFVAAALTGLTLLVSATESWEGPGETIRAAHAQDALGRVRPTTTIGG